MTKRGIVSEMLVEGSDTEIYGSGGMGRWSRGKGLLLSYGGDGISRYIKENLEVIK